MLTKCSLHLVKLVLEKEQLKIKSVALGEVIIEDHKNEIEKEYLQKILTPYGFELILNREERIVEDAKRCIIELIHDLNNINSIVRKSDYLVEKMGMSYQQISKVFSKYEPITLERFTILVKMEKLKEMIISDEYSLSEISYLMDYSSVQYLSNQFKKETGYSVTDYKKLGLNLKKPLDQLY